ncbi:MAG TPA: transcriptional regulator GcvA [Burkholderiales bacterium]|jgi:DNA-binding transcriptional LysR family regulator|nr:transcriptional regulator GcvA [Burkholderiales bacterium]
MLKGARDLPSLDLLKGFEAAARNLSFTKAAAELFVTQSAVSRQIQTLEEQLGVALFRRSHRELRLTEEGQTLYKTASEVLRLLRDVAGRLGARQAGMLTVTTTVSFAALWLVPRLNDFRRQYPGIDMRLAATNEIQDLDRERIDLAIRYCTPKAAGAAAVRLFGELVFPVCSKALLAGRKLASPKDLSGQVLLHYDDPYRRYPWLSWEVWFELTQTQGVKPAGMLRFSHYDQLMHAAIGGQGIALGRSRFVSKWVKQGKLVLPFGRRYMCTPADSRAYFLVRTPRSGARAEVAKFAQWLQEQALAEDAELETAEAPRESHTVDGVK